jgi:hypothetical protein
VNRQSISSDQCGPDDATVRNCLVAAKQIAEATQSRNLEVRDLLAKTGRVLAGTRGDTLEPTGNILKSASDALEPTFEAFESAGETFEVNAESGSLLEDRPGNAAENGTTGNRGEKSTRGSNARSGNCADANTGKRSANTAARGLREHTAKKTGVVCLAACCCTGQVGRVG